MKAKAKIATAILALFVLVAFSGCAQQKQPDKSSAQDAGTKDGTATLTEQQVDQMIQDASDLETGANAMDPNVGDSGVDDSTFQ
ncbi:MAG: hypothetical protein HY394_00660 [Candidatus Diapherotrites archaeon]|nr:hypothetical protein [Candidatus Diapherotrites archaeon]